MVFIPPLPGRDTIHILKGARKMQLVGVANGIADIGD